MINVTVLTVTLFRLYRHVRVSADNMLLGFRVDAAFVLPVVVAFLALELQEEMKGMSSVQADGWRAFSTPISVLFH